jgi:hypothetical protein
MKVPFGNKKSRRTEPAAEQEEEIGDTGVFACAPCYAAASSCSSSKIPLGTTDAIACL